MRQRHLLASVMLRWSTHFLSSLVRGGEYQQDECERRLPSALVRLEHIRLWQISSAKGDALDFPPSVCDLGIFTSRPKR